MTLPYLTLTLHFKRIKFALLYIIHYYLLEVSFKLYSKYNSYEKNPSNVPKQNATPRLSFYPNLTEGTSA